MYVSALFTLHSHFLYAAPYVNMEQADKTPDAKVDETPSIDANMELVDESPNIDAIAEQLLEAEAIPKRRPIRM